MQAKDILIRLSILSIFFVSLSVSAVYQGSVNSPAGVSASVSNNLSSGGDTVILKSGTVVVGTVQEISPDKFVKVLLSDGKVHTYKMSAVVRISMQKKESEEIGEPTPPVAPAQPATRQHPQTRETVATSVPGGDGQRNDAGGASVLRFGLGTDISLGLAIGVGYTYQWTPGAGWPTLEVGPTLVYGKNTKISTGMNGPNWTTKDDEMTKLFIFGMFLNELYQYNPRERGFYFLTGIGLGVVSVHYEDTHSETYIPDPSGAFFPTETNSVDGTVASFIFNFGAGYFFNGQLGMRLELPIFIFLSTVGNTTTFSPAMLLSLQYRIH